MAPAASRSGFALWVKWVTVGELVGFAIPAAAGSGLHDAGGSQLLLVMTFAGAVEGLVVGMAQAVILSRKSEISVGAWTAATAVGASIAWATGMLPSTFWSVWNGWHPVWMVTLGAALATVLLASIGTAQWLVLRGHTDRSITWIGVSALAWC